MLDQPGIYLAEESAWPVDGFGDWDGSGTNVFFQVGDDTLTYRIDRDEAFYDGTAEPEDGAEVMLSGILARFDAEAQFYGGFFDDDILSSPIGAFSLLSPADETSLTLEGKDTTKVEITWSQAKSDSAVTYTWHADLPDGDFSEPLLSIPSNNDGSDTTLTLTYEGLDDALAGLDVAADASINLIWTVTAETNTIVRFADESFALELTRGTIVSNESELIPVKFALEQNYPNPFNPSTKIEFALPETGKAQIEVFNMLGQQVATLVNSQFSAGKHTITFNARGLTSGIYFYRLTTGSSTITKRMTLIK
jgi:hypothetical protein